MSVSDRSLRQDVKRESVSHTVSNDDGEGDNGQGNLFEGLLDPKLYVLEIVFNQMQLEARHYIEETFNQGRDHTTNMESDPAFLSLLDRLQAMKDEMHGTNNLASLNNPNSPLATHPDIEMSRRMTAPPLFASQPDLQMP